MKKESYTNTYGLLDGEEAVTHPAPGRAIPADVGKAAVKVSVRGTEGDLFDGLVHDEALGLVVNHAEPVAVDVEDGADGFALRVLKKKKSHHRLSLFFIHSDSEHGSKTLAFSQVL